MAQEFLIASGGYMNESYPNANNIIDQGIVEIDTSGDYTREGGFTKKSVFREDIKDAITSETLLTGSTTTVTPASIDSYAVQTIVVPSGFALKEAEYNAIATGSNSRSVVQSYVQGFIERHRTFAQANFKRILDGAFNTSGALNSSHYSEANLSVNSGNFSLSTYLGTLSDLFGENVNELTKVVCSQKTWDMLVRYEIGGYVDVPVGSSDSAVQAGNLGFRRVKQLYGREVIVNDTIGASETISDATAYPIYTIGDAPFGIEYQQSFRIAEQYEAGVGGGTYERYMYVNYAPTLKGLSFNNSSLSALSDLSTVGNFTKKWNNKNIQIMKYMVRI